MLKHKIFLFFYSWTQTTAAVGSETNPKPQRYKGPIYQNTKLRQNNPYIKESSGVCLKERPSRRVADLLLRVSYDFWTNNSRQVFGVWGKVWANLVSLFRSLG